MIRIPPSQARSWMYLASIVTTTLVAVSAQGQTCGVVGTDAGELTASRPYRFYLNTQDPAPCDGTVDEFQYCYYDADQFFPAAFYDFTFAVFRETSPGSYSVVSGPFTTGRSLFNHGLIVSGSFACATFAPTNQIEVQAGDMIGACTYDPPSVVRHELDVVGESADDNRYLMATDDSSGCGEDTLPDPVTNSGLSRLDSRVLHVHTSITPHPTTSTPTTSMSEATPPTTMATTPPTTMTDATTPPTTMTETTTPPTTMTDATTPPTTMTETTTPPTTMATTPPTTMVETTTHPTTMATTPPTTMVETTTHPTSMVETNTPPTTLPETTTLTTSVLNTTTPPTLEPDTTTLSVSTAIETTSDTDPPVVETTFTMTLQRNSTTTLGPPATADSLVTTSLSGQPQSPPDNTEVIAAVLVGLFLLIVVTVVATVIAIAVTKRRCRSKTLFREGASGDLSTFQNELAFDNAVYSINDGACTTDYQEIESSTLMLVKPSASNHYEFDYSYETTKANNSVEVSFYAEMGPLQDAIHSSSLDYVPSISYGELLQLNKEEDIYASVNAYEVPASRENEIYAQLQAWKVPHIHRNEIEIGGHLGSGQFGSVEQGVWKRQGTGPVDVALKSLNKTSEEDKVKFLQEAAIMAQFRHPNVITLYGMIVKEDAVMLVVELAKKGDLRNFLLSIAPDPGELMPRNCAVMLPMFSQQVALGLQYLSAKGFVHRDLAARNVLVTSDHTCKVADFGLSRDLADENYYVSHGKDKIPVKWTAPEALHYKKYSTASDVWSYGCLLYEIWSVGHKPFEGFGNIEVLRQIDTGMRLPPPPGTPRTVYELMVNCWHPETSQRPSFRDIVLTLSGSEEMVLNIPEEDSSTNPLAGVLGAPLEAGESIYSELQGRYK